MIEGHEPLPSAEAPVELSVIVPCLNEELNIPELAARILSVFSRGDFRGELIIVDDGSTDGTAAAIRALMKTHPGVVVGCFHPQNRGIAAGWRTGAAVACGKLVAIIDADLQYQPEDLLRLRRTLYDNSVDIVQGWRSAVGRRRDRRYTLSRGLNSLLNLTFGMNMRDNKSGFLMCAREVLMDLLTYKGSYFYWQSFIMVAAHSKGYSYKEIETIFEQRRQGVSFLETTAQIAAVKNLFDLTKAAWEYRVTSPPADVASHFLRQYPLVDRSPERDPLTTLRWRAYLAAWSGTHRGLTRAVEHYYEMLRKTQWLSIERTIELQDEKLRRLLRHCYRNVPFYRLQMQALHLRPEDITSQRDLQKLPVLTREDVRRHLYFDIMSENHEKSQIYELVTSGAIGAPMTFYVDRANLEFQWAASVRMTEIAGHRFGSSVVELWPEAFDRSKRQLAMDAADAALASRTRISVLELSEKKRSEIVRAISRAAPVTIEGWAEALDVIAAHINASPGGLDKSPRAVISGEQVLTPESRNIKKAFGCKVFDRYESREFSTIAHECETHDGLHVVAEGYIVEILKEDGAPAEPGEVGDVVITDLKNFCMPFIRYRIGDRAMAMDPGARCSCGRGSPRMRAIEGRRPSVILGDGGRVVPGTFFAHYLKTFDYAIKRFQVILREPGVMTFRVVRGGRYSQDVLDGALATFRRYLGDRMRIDVELVDEASFQSSSARDAVVPIAMGTSGLAGA